MARMALIGIRRVIVATAIYHFLLTICRNIAERLLSLSGL
jgi:hypothetical protein